MGKYRTLGTFFDRIFRNDLNANFNDIDGDIKTQKARVDNLITATPQPSEVVDLRTGNDGVIHGTAWDRFASDSAKTSGKFDEVDAQLADLAEVEKAIIAFTYDDGYSEDNLTYSVFKEFNLPCSFGLVKDRVVERSPVDNYRQWQDEGFSILSHSATHTHWEAGTGVPIETTTYEFKSSYEDLVALGFRVNGWITPYSEMGDEYIPELKKYYSYGYTKNPISLNVSASAHMSKAHDPFRMHRVSLYANTTDKIKLAIDNCIKYKGLLVFYDHRTGHEDSATEAKLREILTYVKSLVTDKKCVVLNSDDAVNKYFGISFPSHKENISDINKAPSITEFSRSATTDWYTPVKPEFTSDPYGSNNGSFDYTGISFPNGLLAGNTQTFECRLDLTKVDMTKFRNLSVINGMDLRISTAVSGLEVSLETRFRDSAASYDSTHKKVVPVGTVWQTFSQVSTPSKAMTYDNALCYVRVTAKSNIPSGFTIYLANPFVSLGVVRSRERQLRSEVSEQIQLRLTPTAAYVYKAWAPYKAQIDSGVVSENRYLKVYADGSCTFEAKLSGRFLVEFNGNFSTAGALGASQNGRLILEINKTGFSSDVPSRVYYFYSANDRFTFNATYLFDCKKGDKIYAKLYFDDNQGTLTQLSNEPMLKVNYFA